MKSLTLAHAASYLVTALSWVAALNPSIATAVLGVKLGAYAVPLITLAGSLLTAGHQMGVLGAKPAAAASTTAKLMLIAMFVPLLLTLHGCATLSKIDAALTSPAAQPYVTAAVDVAVATAEQKGVTAAQINSIAKAALAADQGVSATLAAVSGVVNTALAKLKLPPGDLAAAQILELAIDASITAKVGANPSVAQSQAAAADVLNALIAVTGG